MIGRDGHRVYLDWNASAPLRPEARDAMFAAMDEVGNPSSVHAEGRKAKAIVERARAQVADLVGCDSGEVVFTSGATEAAHLVLAARWEKIAVGGFEHDCVDAPIRAKATATVTRFDVDASGCAPADDFFDPYLTKLNGGSGLLVLQAANSETGVEQNSFNMASMAARAGYASLVDAVQSLGRRHLGGPDVQMADFRLASAHKLGGPRGVGALVVADGASPPHRIRGGGQEQNRRAGTENVIGVAGFGAAAEAAKRDLDAGVWERVENLRNILDYTLERAVPDLTIFSREAPRLPNTTCFAVPGWKGETQVMQMDLAGFAVSAGSACSSGKVEKASRVLLAMGFDEITASSAIRVSMGPTTTEAEVLAFADAWTAAYTRWKAKAA